jgi:hypothetical protein
MEKGINWQTIFYRIQKRQLEKYETGQVSETSDDLSREFRYSIAVSQFTKNVFLSISMLGLFLQKVEDNRRFITYKDSVKEYS